MIQKIVQLCVLEALIQPCMVEMEKIATEYDQAPGVADISDSTNDFQDEAEINFLRDCDKTQPSLKVLQISTQKVRCLMCKKTISGSRKRLSYHMKNVHKKPARCEHATCDCYFGSADERRKHVRKIHPGDEGGKMCIICGLQFINKSNMVSHVNKFHKGTIRCNFHTRCPKYFHANRERDEHVLRAHKTGILKSEVKCIYCGRICSDKISLYTHIKQIHAAVSVRCKFNQCGLYFLKQTESDEHFRKHHQQEESLKKFKCPKCKFKTTEKHNWLIHIKRNHVREELQCHECQGVFSSQVTLKKHLYYFHSERVSCEHCGKKLQKKSFRRHLMREKCKRCFIVTPCVKLARMHYKICSPDINFDTGSDSEC
jgi:hypothetical protein